MSTQSETLNGQWSTLTDNATQLAGLMTGDLTDGVKTVVGNLNDLTVAAAEAYKTDGWVGLATEIASLNPLISGVINEMSSLGDHLASIGKMQSASSISGAISSTKRWERTLMPSMTAMRIIGLIPTPRETATAAIRRRMPGRASRLLKSNMTGCTRP